jgi:hypothetical protein
VHSQASRHAERGHAGAAALIVPLVSVMSTAATDTVRTASAP